MDDDEDDQIPMLLMLNKYDLVEDLVKSGHDLEEYMTFEYLNKFSTEYGFIGAMCSSAKTGQGIIEAVTCLVRHILLKVMQREECLACANSNGIEDAIYNQYGKKIPRYLKAPDSDGGFRISSRAQSMADGKKKDKKCKC